MQNRIVKPDRLPFFHHHWEGRGIDSDKLGYCVVYGDLEKYVFSPQRYDSYEDAVKSIQDELLAEKLAGINTK